NLAHDYLAPYVRTATEGAETNTERANRMLKRYIAEYKEYPNTRIPFRRVRWIQKYASGELITGDKAQELLKKSKQMFYALAPSLVVPLIILLSLYFFYLSNAYYLSIDDNSYIVLRSGLPQFSFLPGFGQVMIQTDLMRADLAEDSLDE